MSMKNALQFIAQLRADGALREQLISIDDGPELDSFVRLGGKIGLSFTVEELRAAHKYDWGMRCVLWNDGRHPSAARATTGGCPTGT